jgi:hypothetical protein
MNVNSEKKKKALAERLTEARERTRFLLRGVSEEDLTTDPKNAERRRRGQSRGGKSKPGRELLDVKRRLSALADDVLEGNVDRSDAGVVSQVLNVYLRAIGMELKVKEVEELENRLAELEGLLERQGQEGAKRWGS